MDFISYLSYLKRQMTTTKNSMKTYFQILGLTPYKNKLKRHIKNTLYVYTIKEPRNLHQIQMDINDDGSKVTLI